MCVCGGGQRMTQTQTGPPADQLWDSSGDKAGRLIPDRTTALIGSQTYNLLVTGLIPQSCSCQLASLCIFLATLALLRKAYWQCMDQRGMEKAVSATGHFSAHH